MANLNVEVPEALLNEIDEYIKTGRWATRSELARDALREFFERRDIAAAAVQETKV